MMDCTLEMLDYKPETWDCKQAKRGCKQARRGCKQATKDCSREKSLSKLGKTVDKPAMFAYNSVALREDSSDC
jgi:hypothetical protein